MIVSYQGHDLSQYRKVATVINCPNCSNSCKTNLQGFDVTIADRNNSFVIQIAHATFGTMEYIGDIGKNVIYARIDNPSQLVAIFKTHTCSKDRLPISASTKADVASQNLKTNGYLIATGKTDEERLGILNRIYNPSSLEFLQLSSGMKVLTIGCGIGLLEIEMSKKIGNKGHILGTDISQGQLKIANSYKEREAITNLTFQELDLAHLGELSERFDRIHCRLVLSHMPWNTIEKILPIFLSKLAPNGALVLEEISTVDSLKCTPSSEAYDLWVKYFEKQFLAQGSDRSPGNRIHEHLKSNGYDVTCKLIQPILTEKGEKRIYALGGRSLLQNFVEKNIATVEEMSEVIKKLEEMADNPEVSPPFCELSQLFIKGKFEKEL